MCSWQMGYGPRTRSRRRGRHPSRSRSPRACRIARSRLPSRKRSPRLENPYLLAAADGRCRSDSLEVAFALARRFKRSCWVRFLRFGLLGSSLRRAAISWIGVTVLVNTTSRSTRAFIEFPLRSSRRWPEPDGSKVGGTPCDRSQRTFERPFPVTGFVPLA